MNFKRNILVIFPLCLTLLCAGANNISILDSANTAYSKGNYNKAIELYERILNEGMEAPEVYFNLGNAYYKTNAIGLAILNYERAKKLSQNDEDIVFNLKLANQKIEDKIDVAPQLFLTEWKNGIVSIMSEKYWSILCIALTIISLTLLGMYLVSHTIGIKRFGFYGGIVVFLFSVFTYFIAQHSYRISKNSGSGIIISPSVTVVSSPNEKSTKLFILHEGTKVDITEDGDEWMEIKIANGNVGWLKKTDILPI